MLTALLLATAWAQEDCKIAEPEEDDLDAVLVDWARAADGSVAPTLLVRAAASSYGLTYWIESRFRFGGVELTWSDGPLDVVAGEWVPTDYAIAAEARMSPEQTTYFADLSVTLVAENEAGEVVASVHAPLLRVLISSDGTASLLTESEAHEQVGVIDEYGSLVTAVAPPSATGRQGVTP